MPAEVLAFLQLIHDVIAPTLHESTRVDFDAAFESMLASVESDDLPADFDGDESRD